MAETAGLALGAVALASLFQTCVEFLEYFEAARNLSGDRELVGTKLGLLKTRLRRSGYEMKVFRPPGREDGGLHRALANEKCDITRCLVGISGILGDADQLKHKYGVVKRRRLDWCSCFPFLRRPQQPAKSTQLSGRISIRRHVVWAVRDKKRFDSLIQDLDFFVTNLEKLSIRIASPDTNDGRLSCNLEDQNMNTTKTYTTTPFDFPGQHLGSGMRPGQALEQGSRYDGQSSTTDAHQHLGNIGSVNNRQNSYSNQKAGGRSFQQCGDSSEKGASEFWAAKNQPARK